MYNFETIDIIDVLQEYVDKIANEHWKSNTDCPPKFWVSLLNDFPEDECKHKIILTIDHGYKFSRVIFPQKNRYGYNSLFSDMELLYNKTMGGERQ